MGDIIYSLPTIEAFGGGVLWIRKQLHYTTLCSLLEMQPCIVKTIPNLPEKKGYINLDRYRTIERVAYRKGEFRHLAVCHLDAFDKKADLTVPWLHNVVPNGIAAIVVSRSTRYHDRELIDWKLLEGRDVVFIGYEGEYEQFLFSVNGNIKYYKCEDALEMAQVIKGSKLFLGNQSLGFAIAEAMKHPRVLEVYHKNANCMPQGDDGYTYLDEELLDSCLI